MGWADAVEGRSQLGNTTELHEHSMASKDDTRIEEIRRNSLEGWAINIC